MSKDKPIACVNCDNYKKGRQKPDDANPLMASGCVSLGRRIHSTNVAVISGDRGGHKFKVGKGREQLLAQQKGKTYRKPRSNLRQGMLPLEIVSKGRFEKSEPTIHHGEDLDVPTYIRRGVPLN
jgi:hypothetical protein